MILPRTDFAAQENARTIVGSEIIKEGLKIYGWRHVINSSIIGDKTKATRPEIEQILICNEEIKDEKQFDNKLYIIRKRIEKEIRNQNISDFYICSLSCQSIVYKGMFLAEQLSNFIQTSK